MSILNKKFHDMRIIQEHTLYIHISFISFTIFIQKSHLNCRICIHAGTTTVFDKMKMVQKNGASHNYFIQTFYRTTKIILSALSKMLLISILSTQQKHFS